MAGVYTFLPLGLKVLNNIANIVREEMDAIGGQEVLMPALQLKAHYETTGRWSDEVVDDWFKTKLVNGTELGLGFSHEEDLTPLIKNFITSYKDLPIAVYQVQTKFLERTAQQERADARPRIFDEGHVFVRADPSSTR